MKPSFCVVLAGLLSLPIASQELPTSGVTGYDFVYATSPSGTSQLYSVNLSVSVAPKAFGAPVNAVPSRWAHRRRTLGALETAIASDPGRVFVTPMGDAPATGALHLVDLRTPAPFTSLLVPTGNPAAYDVALLPGRELVFVAEDDGLGGTLLRGFSYATPGQLTPLVPPTLRFSGPPAAYVNRLGIDEVGGFLHVATADGVGVVSLSSTAPNMTARTFVPCAPGRVTTNPVSFMDAGTRRWIVGTSSFDLSEAPETAGFLSWDAGGNPQTGVFGIVPSTPAKTWIPAAGAEELAVCSNGIDTYVYYLLREPPPGTFFVKPSSIGVVKFLGGAAPTVSTIAMPVAVGEPFANPAVHGGRVAFESSFGPPFTSSPPGGGERVSILYSPLDPLGAGSADGVLGVPAPLGGRISTKGMDRPIWTPDGTRVLAATSHFAGAPNPGIPGLEVLEVPAAKKVDSYSSPHTALPNLPFPNQSIVYPGLFVPREPALASSVAGLTFYGNVFHQGTASLLVAPFGELGQFQPDPFGFTQPPTVVNFPAILPPYFDDANGSKVPVPGTFGARRTSFNLNPAFGLVGLTMAAAIDDLVLVQPTGFDVLATLGLFPPIRTLRLRLPAGWSTTTEFASL